MFWINYLDIFKANKKNAKFNVLNKDFSACVFQKYLF